MLNLTFISTAGHGYLEVNKALYKENKHDFKPSEYSFHNKNNVYLEEDCDAPAFIDVLKQYNIEYDIDDINVDELQDVAKDLRRFN